MMITNIFKNLQKDQNRKETQPKFGHIYKKNIFKPEKC